MIWVELVIWILLRLCLLAGGVIVLFLIVDTHDKVGKLIERDRP